MDCRALGLALGLFPVGWSRIHVAGAVAVDLSPSAGASVLLARRVRVHFERSCPAPDQSKLVQTAGASPNLGFHTGKVHYRSDLVVLFILDSRLSSARARSGSSSHRDADPGHLFD